MPRIEPGNAIAYAQLQLRGGAKNLVWISLIMLLLVGGIGGSILASNADHLRETARAGAYLMLGLQWLLLTVYGTTRVSAAIRLDLTSGIIESHRLTPNAPLAAMFGYVFGAPVQAFALAGVMFVLGLAVTVMGGLPVTFWFAGNLMAFAGAVLLWTLTAVASFVINQAGLMPAMGLLTGLAGAILIIVPAVSVIAAPLAGQSLWQIQSPGKVPIAYLFTLAANFLLSGVFFLAAARRYRSVATDGFNIRLGLLLLLVWAALTVIGIVMADDFIGPMFRGNDVEEQTRMIAGVVSSILIAFIPVATCARASVMPAEMFEPGRPARWPAPPWLLIPVCIAMVCSAVLVPQFTWSHLAERQLGTAAVVTIVLVAVAFLFAFSDLRGRRGWVGVITYLLLQSLIPVIAEVIIHPLNGFERAGAASLFNFSPFGALITLWGESPSFAWVGIIGQSTVVLIPGTMFAVRWARYRRGEANAHFADDGVAAA